MKMSVMAKLRHTLQEQTQILGAVGQILNRPINTSGLMELSYLLESETRKSVEKIVSGNTQRIRTLKDIALLQPDLQPDMDTSLLYCSLEAEGVQGDLSDTNGVWPIRLLQLEMIRVWFMTHPEVAEEFGACLDLDALAKQHRFLFHVIDHCRLMHRLNDPMYITLQGAVSLHNGGMEINRFICPSEEVDYTFEQYDRQNRVSVNRPLIFEEFFGRLFKEGFPVSDLDLGHYKEAFDAAPVETVQDGRRFVVYVGVKNNVGKFHETHYVVWAYNDSRTLLRIEGPDSAFPQRENVSDHAYIPWMVACMALDMPEEKHFLVQYDQEEKSVVIIPGDPYVEPDSLAEVLPDSGAPVSD